MWRGVSRRLAQRLPQRSGRLERPAEQAFKGHISQGQSTPLAQGQSSMLVCLLLTWRTVYSTAARRSFSDDRRTSPFFTVPTFFTTLAASLLGTIGICHAESSSEKKSTADEDVMALLANLDLTMNGKKFGPGNSMYIAPDNLRLVRKLNEGSFGQIWLGELRDGNHAQEVAVKLLSEDFLAQGCLTELLKAEAAIFHRVSTRCHHVCRLYGVACKDGQVCLVMKLYKKSLHDMLAERRGHMAVSDIQKYGIQVCKGLVELHEQGVIMQDLKPANILIDDLDHAVLADFGVASLVDGGLGASVVTAAKGTPSYMAPEAWNPATMGGMSTKTDMWSLACVIIELYTGLPPWHGLDVHAIAGKVKDEGQMPRIPRGLPAPLASVLRRCLSFNPDERPQAREVLEVFTSGWGVLQEHEDGDCRYTKPRQGLPYQPMMIQGSYWVPGAQKSRAPGWAPITIQGSMYVPSRANGGTRVAQESVQATHGSAANGSQSLEPLRASDNELCRVASRFARTVEIV